jgi:hypothetical protein
MVLASDPYIIPGDLAKSTWMVLAGEPYIIPAKMHQGS